jgi:uncharacterized LabA/DUF88 family protein
MPTEPALKRVHAYVDGQNLFHAARAVFGASYPDFDPRCLADRICLAQGWELARVRFYSGVPDPAESPQWSRFWDAKLKAMRDRGVSVFTRPLAYRRGHDESGDSRPVAVEKGIDIRIAIDVVRDALDRACDVALIFSQDADLAEVAAEVRRISREQERWIKVACAFPVSSESRFRRGVDGTDWLPFEHRLYRDCKDPLDYREDPTAMATHPTDEAWATWTPDPKGRR